MSAFQVSPNHIATMVDAALLHRMGSFYHHPSRRSVTVRHETREDLCKMLAQENLASLEARYEPKQPGLPVFDFPRHPSKALHASPVALLKAVKCYEYQACEHDGWRASEAFAFCEALKGTLIRVLPGFDSAETWGIE